MHSTAHVSTINFIQGRSGARVILYRGRRRVGFRPRSINHPSRAPCRYVAEREALQDQIVSHWLSKCDRRPRRRSSCGGGSCVGNHTADASLLRVPASTRPPDSHKPNSPGARPWVVFTAGPMGAGKSRTMKWLHEARGCALWSSSGVLAIGVSLRFLLPCLPAPARHVFARFVCRDRPRSPSVLATRDARVLGARSGECRLPHSKGGALNLSMMPPPSLPVQTSRLGRLACLPSSFSAQL